MLGAFWEQQRKIMGELAYLILRVLWRFSLVVPHSKTFFFFCNLKGIPKGLPSKKYFEESQLGEWEQRVKGKNGRVF